MTDRDASSSVFSSIPSHPTFGLTYSVTSWICFTVGIVLNFALIVVVTKCSLKQLKSFGKLLIQSCVVDIYTLAISAVVQPVYIVIDGKTILLQTGPFRAVDQPWHTILILMWDFGYYFSVISIVIQFIYRYLAICRGIVLTAFQYAATLAAGALLVDVYIGLQFIAMSPHKNEESIELAIATYFDHRTEVGMVGIPGSWFCVTMCLYTIVVEALCYVTIIMCSVMITRSVHKIAEGSDLERTAEINRQLSLTLTIQAVLPLAALLVGIFCVIICSIIKISQQELSIYFVAYFMLVVPVIPVLNPLVTLLVIKPYRNFIFRRTRTTTINESGFVLKPPRPVINSA
ncbi:7TM GPCR protein [Aphelenchoides avenae]|nr:7TM GPCR protein [Aphelenchus avenae]